MNARNMAKKIIPKKTPMREQPPKERARNYDEVPYGYSETEAIQEASRCLQCKRPTCIEGCPVEIDIPGFIDFIAKGDFRSAINRLKEKNVLPAVCGRVCPQEDQCEKICVLAKKYEPVAIGRLERFAADWEKKQGEVSIPKIPPSTGKKVAVIGAGPGGLTVAGDLIKLGHAVTIFEALHKPGGVLVYSTCSLEPEENEGVVSYLLEKAKNVRMLDIELPLKRGDPILEFEGKEYNEEVHTCLRLWPQDNDTEGFFVAGMKKQG